MWTCGASAASLIGPEDRIVFIGDSITGQGGNGGPNGWVGLIGGALRDVDAANRQTLIALGGSGQTVGGWVGVERKSRTAPTFLDVKAFDLQQELGRPADVVIIMLGMNDVLSPQQEDSDAGYEKWIASYRTLIGALRERTTPRLIALATPTPCTEDASSPKNGVMDRMVERLSKLAMEEKCALLPAREASWEMLAMGRRVLPTFHITTDEVHPNPFGHLAIAIGMLRGLGEPTAADLLVKRSVEQAQKLKGVTSLSHEITLVGPSDETDGTVRFRITAYGGGTAASLDMPEVWKVISKEQRDGGATVFVVAGRPDRLVNRLTLRGAGQSQEITFPAPWRLAAGNLRTKGWNRGVFEPENGRLDADDVVRTGADFVKRSAWLEFAPGVPVQWKTFVGGVNYGGNGAPGVVDFAAVHYFRLGETGYGLRWVRSDKERVVTARVRRTGFAGVSHLELWVNGETVLIGDPAAKAVKHEAAVTLKAGWNLISFKSNFWQWQWQFAVDLEPLPGDALDDLRFSIVPPQS